jgi:polyisoprenoid-binding protein YceI
MVAILFKGGIMMVITRNARTCAITLACFVAFVAGADADDTLRVASGEVSVLCPLTVGGSFDARTKAVNGAVAIPAPDAQAIGGELTVDLQTLETGIGLRDRHMKSNYLEVERGAEFAQARLQDIRVERLEGKTTFRGVMTLHGERKEVSGTAEIEPQGNGYRLKASFPLRLSDFRIPEPTYLGVGVKDEVTVNVNLRATPAAAVARRERE